VIPLTAALASGPGGPGGPLVDWLAWGATDREVRTWLRTARTPAGPFAASWVGGAPPVHPDDPTLYAAEIRIEDVGEFQLALVREAVVFTNPTDRPLDLLRLRVFGNVLDPRLPARVAGVWVAGLPAPHLLDGSVLAVRLPRPLPPGATTRVLIELMEPLLPFAPDAPVEGVGWSPARGGVLGEADDQVALGLALPTVTAFGADGQDTRPVGWNELPALYDPAWWHVSLTHPARYTLASTGVVTSSSADDQLVTEQIVAGGARDFAAHLVPDATVSTVEVGGTTLRVVWRDLEGEDVVGADLLRIGEEALRTLSERFGPLTAREIDVVEGPIRGLPALDYPELVVVDTRHAHRPYHRSARHEWALVHSLAHQWWGHEVGTDGLAEPWLDEGLAEHSAALYWEARYGREAVVDRHDVEFVEPLGQLVARGIQLLPGTLPADGYDLTRYPILVDGRAAMFFDGLRRAWGDEAWTRALRGLRSAGAGRRLSGAEVLALLQRTAPEGLDVELRFHEQMVSPTFLEDLVTPAP
jgi:hypothetical protein